MIGQEAFGIKSATSVEPAKDLIFPRQPPPPATTASSELYDDELARELYKRSHHSYAPGEQRRRGYNWKTPPEEIRFGRRGESIAFNGVSANIHDVLFDSSSLTATAVVNPKEVEDFRNMGHILGQSRNLGQNSGLGGERGGALSRVYGKPSGKKTVSAAEVIRGNYTEADQLPDRDLGRSVLPGFRNLTVQVGIIPSPSSMLLLPNCPNTKLNVLVRIVSMVVLVFDVTFLHQLWLHDR